MCRQRWYAFTPVVADKQWRLLWPVVAKFLALFVGQCARFKVAGQVIRLKDDITPLLRCLGPKVGAKALPCKAIARVYRNTLG